MYGRSPRRPSSGSWPDMHPCAGILGMPQPKLSGTPHRCLSYGTFERCQKPFGSTQRAIRPSSGASGRGSLRHSRCSLIEQGRAQGARFGSAQAGCASRRRRARTTGGGQIPSSYGCPVAGVWPVTAPLLAVEFDQATCRIRVLPQALAYLRTVAIEGECLPVANDRSSRATAGARVPIR
ncbi:MAG: hypothetical protein RL458_2820 [Pseudomonadota bacterium]